MPNRRQTIITGLALALTPSLSLAQGRSNPMPDGLRRDLERDPTAPVLGNRDGNITLTEFFDYNCSFCRRMVGTMQQLVTSDPNLRVVFREWPVFGEGSEFATRASLASLAQGKYWQFHAAMMKMRGRAEEASVMRVAREVGLDEAKLRKDMQAENVSRHIDMSFQLGDHMGLEGTPTFICGDAAAFGAMSLPEMREFVANGRRALGVAG